MPSGTGYCVPQRHSPWFTAASTEGSVAVSCGKPERRHLNCFLKLCYSFFFFFLLEIQQLAAWRIHPTLLRTQGLTSPSLLPLPDGPSFTRKGNNRNWAWHQSIFPHVILAAEKMVSCSSHKQAAPRPPQPVCPCSPQKPLLLQGPGAHRWHRHRGVPALWWH